MILKSKCLICHSCSNFVFQAQLLFKYNVSYFLCENCGFIQTENPYWLNEAYSTAISALDVGLVSRNISLSQQASNLIKDTFNAKATFLDYAGGYGLFVRMMRDNGFDFYRDEPFCINLFAQGFDRSEAVCRGKFELVTAFEVFEHLSDPLSETMKILELSDSILFSTELIKNNIKEVGDWWYFVPETGQHISFFSMKSLEVLARQLNCKLFSNRMSLHLLTKRDIADPFMKRKRSLPVRVVEKFLQWLSHEDPPLPSLLQRDFDTARARVKDLNSSSGRFPAHVDN